MAFLNINISTPEVPFILTINTDQITYAQDNGDGTASVIIHGVPYTPQGKTFAEIQTVLGATDFLVT